MYSLYKGFKKIGEFESIYNAKKEAPNEDGVYNITDGKGFRTSWQILNGVYYGD